MLSVWTRLDFVVWQNIETNKSLQDFFCRARLRVSEISASSPQLLQLWIGSK